MRLYARRVLPATPFARLTGYGIGHVSTGTLTGTLKASGHLVFPPAYNLSALSSQALYACGITAVDAEMDLDPITVSVQYFRSPRPQPGNFLARARVLNSSSYFVSCSAELEDPVGRLVGFPPASGAYVASTPHRRRHRRRLNRPATPCTRRPTRRIVPLSAAWLPLDLQARHSGLELSRMVMAGELPPLPLMHTCGARWVALEEGEVRAVMPASEWFCSSSHTIEPGAIESFVNIVSTTAALTIAQPGEHIEGLEQTTRFLRRVPADGRQLSSRGKVAHRSGNLVTRRCRSDRRRRSDLRRAEPYLRGARPPDASPSRA